MRIGITGHQYREGADWIWASKSIAQKMDELASPLEGYSSLAAGSDQVFAEVLLSKGGKLFAVIPMQDYERCFAADALQLYRELKTRSEVILLGGPGSDQELFFNAGKYVADHVDRMFAVWDGKPAGGFGGTADIIDYALGRKLPVTRFDPIKRTIEEIGFEASA